MADYTHLLGQSRRVQELAQQSQAQREARNAARLGAYRWLAADPTGQLVLDDLALVLLKPCETAYDEGERRLVLKIFTVIEEATRLEGTL